MAFEGTQTNQTVLLTVEAEAFIESLEVLSIRDVGSPKWMKQHEYLEKINMQAVMNATTNEDEFIKELLISRQKIPVLIHDLLTTEVWRSKIFSIIQKLDFNPKTTFPLYMALYHEATVTNLLETILFHKEPCESAEDCIIDLVDFCHRKILDLIARKKEDMDIGYAPRSKNMNGNGSMEELKIQDNKLQFDVGVKAISILRYITDHLESLPLSVATRLLNTQDAPCLLAQLIEDPPWSYYDKGKLWKYADGKWGEVSVNETLHLSRLDGQIWIALFNLLLGPHCQNKYAYNDHNKNQILKLRGYITEVVLDQIPSLVDLQRYLEHLAMMEPPSASAGLVLEQVPEIYDRLLKENEGKWSAIAKHQVKTVFNPSNETMKAQAKRFAETYNFDVLESLISDPPKCALCGDPASKRCSRCKIEWYCGRECQVNHWPKHKVACNLVTNPPTEKESPSR